MVLIGDDHIPEVIVENDISTHNVAGYTIDVLFVVALIVAIIIWRWRRTARRLKDLEGAAQRLRQQQNLQA